MTRPVRLRDWAQMAAVVAGGWLAGYWAGTGFAAACVWLVRRSAG